MEHCPNCAVQSPGQPLCRRCGMELTLLLAVEAQAAKALGEALSALSQGCPQVAQAALTRAQKLQRDPLLQTLWDLIATATTSAPAPISDPDPASTQPLNQGDPPPHGGQDRLPTYSITRASETVTLGASLDLPDSPVGIA